MRRGIARAALGVALWAATLASTRTAKAGAWNEEAGHGLVIADLSFSGGGLYFNGAGRLSRAAAYSKQEAIGYLEYGLTDDVTLIVKPSLSRVSAAVSTDRSLETNRSFGLGATEAAAQLHLLTFGPAVLAVQGGFRLPGTTSRDNPANIGNTAYEAEGRALGGYSFDLGAVPAFVDVEAAYRMRSGGASAEWHVDLTVGVRPVPRLALLVQSFNVLCDGRGTSWFPASSYSKLGIAAIYDIDERWSLETGMFQTIMGIGALRERGAHVAVWYRF